MCTLMWSPEVDGEYLPLTLKLELTSSILLSGQYNPEFVFFQLLSDILGKAGTEQDRLFRMGKCKRGFRDGYAGVKFHIVNVFVDIR